MSEHEQAALFVIRSMRLPEPMPEYRFCGRQYRFDYAWKRPGTAFPLLALEVEGGQWVAGRHVRGKGFENDCRKYSMAASLGWTVLRVTPAMITDGTLRELLERCFKP